VWSCLQFYSGTASPVVRSSVYNRPDADLGSDFLKLSHAGSWWWGGGDCDGLRAGAVDLGRRRADGVPRCGVHGGRRIRTAVSNPTRSASCISPNILCRLASARKTSINTAI